MLGRLMRTTDVQVVFSPSSSTFQLDIQGHPLTREASLMRTVWLQNQVYCPVPGCVISCMDV